MGESGMKPRAGFSLVEMVIVLVLAGIVSTAAISMFTTQNRLHEAMTALGESQESARSAVQLAASELRAVNGGTLVLASAERVILRYPIVIGWICGAQNQHFKAVYLPLTDSVIDLHQDVDGYAFRSTYHDDWFAGFQVSTTDGFRGGSRGLCIDAGNGEVGSDGNYATLRVDGEIGEAVMLYREIVYSFGTSSLDPSRRAFFRTSAGQQVELAQGFSADSRFEYLLWTDTTWVSSLTDDLRDVIAIRLIAEVVAESSPAMSTGSPTFSLTREISLRNVQ